MSRHEQPMPLSDPLNRTDDASELSPSGPYRAVKQLGLVLLCAAWILLGLVGHDPWKPDDATAFGTAYDMLKQGDWIVPHLASAPVPERPPCMPSRWYCAALSRAVRCSDSPSARRFSVAARSVRR